MPGARVVCSVRVKKKRFRTQKQKHTSGSGICIRQASGNHSIRTRTSPINSIRNLKSNYGTLSILPFGPFFRPGQGKDSKTTRPSQIGLKPIDSRFPCQKKKHFFVWSALPCPCPTPASPPRVTSTVRKKFLYTHLQQHSDTTPTVISRSVRSVPDTRLRACQSSGGCKIKRRVEKRYTRAEQGGEQGAIFLWL